MYAFEESNLINDVEDILFIPVVLVSYFNFSNQEMISWSFICNTKVGFT